MQPLRGLVLRTPKASANATVAVRWVSWQRGVATKIECHHCSADVWAPLFRQSGVWGRVFRTISGTATATSDGPSDLQAEHEQVLVEFFDKMDVNANGWVNHVELESGLDKLFSSVPSYYALASNLLWTIAEGEGAGVKKEDWVKAVQQYRAEDLPLESLLPDLKRAVDALVPKDMRRRARHRVIFGNSLKIPSLQPVLAPKQRIEGMSTKEIQAAGLRRFEHILDGYELVKVAGGGAFAKVFIVRNTTTGDVQAIKRIDREHVQKVFKLTEAKVAEQVEHEFRHLQHTEHPHIVKLFEFRHDARYSYLVMEAANGGSLKGFVDATYKHMKGQTAAGSARVLSEGYAAMVMEQTLEALDYLHSDHRIHKDIKLENLMLLSEEAPPHVVLIDLGFAEMQVDEDESGSLTPAGSPPTMAPEVIDAFLGRRPQFNEKCDIWSLGVSLFELLSGKLPYQVVKKNPSPNAELDYEATRKAMESLDLRPVLAQTGRSQKAVDMIEQMLTLDPDQRPSAKDCLRHPWMVQQGERRKRRIQATGRQPPTTGRYGSVGESLLKTRRDSISSAVNEFGRKSAGKRAAAYHCAQHIPLSKLHVTESFNNITEAILEWRCDSAAPENLEDFLDVQLGEDLESAADLDLFVKALQSKLGVDYEGAKYVVSAMGTDTQDLREFATSVDGLCREREQVLVGYVSAALDSAGPEGLTVEEICAALERSTTGNFPPADVQEWLQKGAPVNLVTVVVSDVETRVKRCDPADAFAPKAMLQKEDSKEALS